MSRIIVVGATGTIGSAVVDLFEGSHEVVRVGHRRGDYHVDLASRSSITKLFEQVGAFDALVCAAGRAAFGAFTELGDDDFALGLENKLMGQINLVRLGLAHVRSGGSFTLTSGVLSRSPVHGSSAVSMANAGLEGFVRAAALEVEDGVRINVVSPVWVKETLAELGRDPSGGMPASKVAYAYRASIESRRNGEILDVREFC